MDDNTQIPQTPIEPSTQESNINITPSDQNPIAIQPATDINAQPTTMPEVATNTTIENHIDDHTMPMPAAPGPVADMPAETPIVNNNSGDSKKILLVEDDEALAAVYKTRLTAEGFDIKHVPNGEDALAAALSYKPNLILLDVMMPKVSGFDVLDILRNTPETAHVKVIMLTALSQDADKQRAQSLGVDEYLVKSQVVIADVVEKIKKLLGIS